MVTRVGEDLRGEDNTDTSPAMGGAGDESGVAFAVQALADLLAEIVFARSGQLGVVGQFGAEIKQQAVALNLEDAAFADDGFWLLPEVGVVEELQPVVGGFEDTGLEAVGAVPDAEVAIGVAAAGPVFERVADGGAVAGLFERAVDDGIVAEIGGFGGEFGGDGGVPVVGLVAEVVEQVLGFAQADDVAQPVAVVIDATESAEEAVDHWPRT